VPDTDAELLLTIEGPLAWLAVNRLQARNALNLAVWKGLRAELHALAERTDVRVVIVRGAGREAFMAGADITEFPAARADAAMTAEYDRHTGLALAAIAALEKPVIAMINGVCFGGGCTVALACDLRFAADHARFAIPAVRLGLAYPLFGVERLLHVVGPGAAADILLSGRALQAEEALQIGLINRIVARDELEAVTREYALRMAEGAPLTQAAHKAGIQELLRPAAERDPARIHALSTRCFNSADYREGVAAFMEKRKPSFAGK
jgi:enoyl-CoA hydratase